jgi:hypothetical protein
MVEFDDGLAQTIRGAVHARREDAVSLLRELVRVPSVTGAVGAVVGRAFSERGLDVDTASALASSTWLRTSIDHSGASAPLGPGRAV